MQDNPDTVKNRHTSAGKSAEGRKLLFWRIAAGVLFLAVIALGLLLFFSRSDMTVQPEAPADLETTPEPAVSYTAWCYAPVGEPQQLSAQSGEEITLPQGPQIDGYTFLGWTDENGAAVKNGRTKLYGDAAFSAVYAIAFRDCAQDAHHAPYLSVDGEAYFRPAGSVSRAQAAKLLYESLDTDLVGSAVFADVDPAADYAAAAATLKELGVLSESRFHPDDPISLGEMFDMLAHFFPKSAKTYSFASVPESDARYGAFCLAMEQGWIDDPSVSPDADLSRATAARIFNRLRGRIPPAKIDYAMVGTIMDVSYADPLFPDIAEAAIAHDAELTADGEVWTAGEALPRREEGFFFIGTALHCIDENGGAVVNGSYGNFDFGPDGVITTGMPELDELVQAKLRELVDPATMEPERMLYLIYNYVTYSNEYLRVHYYDVGDTSWVNDEAYHMFTVGKGNCYCYASQFYVMAKAIGFDAVIYSGTIEPDDSPHAWVEIEIDGEWYIYDTNLEYTQVHFNDYHGSFYKEPYWKAKGWHYFRGDEIEAEIAARG